MCVCVLCEESLLHSKFVSIADADDDEDDDVDTLREYFCCSSVCATELFCSAVCRMLSACKWVVCAVCARCMWSFMMTMLGCRRCRRWRKIWQWRVWESEKHTLSFVKIAATCTEYLMNRWNMFSLDDQYILHYITPPPPPPHSSLSLSPSEETKMNENS